MPAGVRRASVAAAIPGCLGGGSSPLITLARISRLDLLRQLFGRVLIASEMRVEVVVRGAGRPAAGAVADAAWIESHPPADAGELAVLRANHALRAGELATVLLARTLSADFAIIDERSARRLARAQGVAVMGCVGILEFGFRPGFVPDFGSSSPFACISVHSRLNLPAPAHSGKIRENLWN